MFRIEILICFYFRILGVKIARQIGIIGHYWKPITLMDLISLDRQRPDEGCRGNIDLSDQQIHCDFGRRV